MTVLGIDIGVNQIRCGRVDGEGRVLSTRAFKTPPSLDAFETAMHYIVASGEPPAGIGIGCRGVVDPRTTRVGTPGGGAPRYLEGQTLAELIRPALRAAVPIRADSQARLALAWEREWGAARGCSNALLFLLDDVVSGAAMCDGRLLGGECGAAGQFGHIPVEPDGAPCACGSRGCLETVCSTRAMEAAAFGAVRRGCPSLLGDGLHGRPGEITCRAVFEALAAGDGLAGRVVERAAGALAAAVRSLASVLDPETVILGGEMADAGEALLGPLQREIQRRGRGIPIVPQEAPNGGGVAGAAALFALRAEPERQARTSGWKEEPS